MASLHTLEPLRVSVFLFFLHMCGCQELVISPLGSQVRPTGSTIFFTCSFNPEDTPTTDLIWTNTRNQPITDTEGRVHVERDGSTSRLYLLNINEDDAGDYTCEARSGGRTFTQHTSLSLYEDVVFSSTPNVVEYKMGTSPLLQCTATGNPDPDISWRFNLRLIPRGLSRYTYEPDGLRIHSIGLRDNGTYECRAEVTSQGTVKVKHISLNVLYAPQISSAIDVSSVVEHRRAVFTCGADGNPPVKYEWYREQNTEGWARAKVKLAQGSPQFIISNVTLADEGRYFCKVSNKLGQREIYTDVVVQVTPEVRVQETSNLLEGNTLMLDCLARGVPPPVLTWRNTSTDQVYTPGIQENDNRITIDNAQPGKSRFIIQGVRRTDSGLYSCTAENSVGTDGKYSQLTVEFAPVVVSNSTLVKGWAEQVITFNCTATGLPLPTINWLHANRVINNRDIYSITTTTEDDRVDSTLQITIARSKRWVYGNYECGAKSKHGYVKHEVHLKEAFVPTAPHNVTTVEERTTSILLEAAMPIDDGGMPITSWLIESEPTDKELQRQLGITTYTFEPDAPLLVVGLEPDTAYNFYVAVGNVVGFGQTVRFRVKTIGRQSDVPSIREEEQEQAGEADVEDEEESEKVTESVDKTNKMSNRGSVTGDQPTPAAVKPDGDPVAPPVAIIIGGVVALAVVVIVIVGLVMVKRRRRKLQDNKMYGYPKRRPGELNGSVDCVVTMNEAKDIDHMHLEIRKTSLPDLVHHKAQADVRSPHESRKPSPATMASPIPSRVTTDKLNKSAMNGGVAVCTKQRDAWDQMLRVALTSDEELDEDEEDEGLDASPVIELPPPPAFLLEQDAAPRHDNESYQDILDGYCSGDNVDDEATRRS